MVNNFEQIKNLLDFETIDDFYHLQIIKRKKEHPELRSNSYIVKTYFITSLEHLDFHTNEIIHLCDFHNARGCINLNRRSFEKIAFHTMRKIAEQLMNKDFKSARMAYTSCCGAFSNEKNKKWIIDIDHKDLNEINEIKVFINNQIEPAENKVVDLIETKNGYHLITKPFNLAKFKEMYPCIDVHKDNPTILFQR